MVWWVRYVFRLDKVTSIPSERVLRCLSLTRGPLLNVDASGGRGGDGGREGG